jgi:phospholipid transport system substrate-binding protein
MILFRTFNLGVVAMLESHGHLVENGRAWRAGGFTVAAIAIALGFAAPAFTAKAAQPAMASTLPAAVNTAEGFVQQSIDRGYVILKDAKITEAQRQAQFHDFLLGLMDARRIGMFTLGQYANTASKTDIEAFVPAFADFTAAVYETRLIKYKEQLLKVIGSSARAADDVVVNCNVTDPAQPSAPPYKVSFRIRKSADGNFIVTDMNIEGIWQTLSQRADFTGFLQQHGGRLGDLVNDLKRQTKLLYASS